MNLATARRRLTTFAAALIAIVLAGTPTALACGFLVAANGSVQLLRTTTLVAYSDGIEHYVTSFEYAGGDIADFGSIIPLPDIPTSVERGGDWTLQRLNLETNPLPLGAAFEDGTEVAATGGVEVILETRIDALDITVLTGGGADVADWADENGYFLPDDATEYLEFYAQRSPVFMAARFDAARAAELGQNSGDGTPIHVTIPTDEPWVPLRILAMAKAPGEIVEADVYVLTDDRPALLYGQSGGVSIAYDQSAGIGLLDDLRSDAGMEWVPETAWLTKLVLDVPADRLNYDLAINTRGDTPSYIDAGLRSLGSPQVLRTASESGWLLVPLGILAAAGIAILIGGPLWVGRRTV